MHAAAIDAATEDHDEDETAAVVQVFPPEARIIFSSLNYNSCLPSVALSPPPLLFCFLIDFVLLHEVCAEKKSFSDPDPPAVFQVVQGAAVGNGATRRSFKLQETGLVADESTEGLPTHGGRSLSSQRSQHRQERPWVCFCAFV